MGKKHPNEIRIWKEIGSILWNDWDPIGVNDRKEARDEYDDYIGGIYGLLQSNTSVENIADHLDKIVMEAIGLEPSRKHNLEVATKLKEINLYEMGDEKTFDFSEYRSGSGSLVPCKNCNQPIPASSIRCPHCGIHFRGIAADFVPGTEKEPITHERWIKAAAYLILMLVVGVLLLFFGHIFFQQGTPPEDGETILRLLKMIADGEQKIYDQ